MDGDEDWLIRGVDRELAGANLDFDAVSFDDSERFEGDSDGDSYGSFSDGLNWDWRDAVQSESHAVYGLPGRSRSGRISATSDSTAATLQHSPMARGTSPGTLLSLSEIAARSCAKYIAFYQLESMYRCINMLKRNKLYPYVMDNPRVPVSDTLPDTLFLKIIFHCFPSNLQDIRLYSVMASGKPDNFNTGEMLYSSGAVTEVVQIGYLISANVNEDVFSTRVVQNNTKYSVSIKVDRCRIIYSKCSCDDPSQWCRHICALIMYRLREPHNVQYRVTIWDAINELDVNKLKKFAQYLINELPREHLPMAQRLLDQLSDPHSEINSAYGAPDPTDGGHDPIAVMNCNEKVLHEMVRRQLNCFSLKQAQAHGIDEMNSTKNSSALEFQRHLQPLANLDPPAMNNFIVMVKSMLSRKDPNAISLIRIATEECIANRLVLLHWYCSKLVQSGKWHTLCGKDEHQARQLNIGQLCDELVNLWRWVALNPSADREYREQLKAHLQRYHTLAADRIFKIIKSSPAEESLVGSVLANIVNNRQETLSCANARFTMDCFPGFHTAIKVCVAMENMEIGGIPVEPFHGWMKWPEQMVELLPETVPQSPKKRTKKRHRRHHDRRNSRRSSRDHTRNSSRNRPVMMAQQGNAARSRRREVESSESGAESDEEAGRIQQVQFPEEDVSMVLAASHLPMERFETRFAQCEAAAAHGYTIPAVRMAMDLMQYLLAHAEEASSFDLCQPSTSSEIQMQANFEQQQVHTAKRIDTLEKSVFLANVLMKDRDRHSQAKLFQFIVKILLFSKSPMSSKYAQVKEHYLEMELLKVLQTIDIHEAEVRLLRECADRIRDIVENEGIPPLGLAKFLFEELTYSTYVVKFDQVNQPHYRSHPARNGRIPEDDDIAFGAALNALGSRIPYSDAEYPMLLESVRSMKGHLVVSLLVSFKDDKERLGVVVDRLLDPRLHQLYKKCYTNSVYFMKEAAAKKRLPWGPYFMGQRPPFPNQTEKSKADQQDKTDPAKTAEEEAELKKMMQKQLDVVKQSQYESKKQSQVHQSKGKRFKTRFLTNATEAYSNFMCELGKRVLTVAGGNPTVIFSANPSSGGTHRNLHLCSLLISLYGLGVSNKGKKDVWRTRNYSQEVSWIHQQISEIGPTAYDIVREIYWEFHFTPAEMALLSEKALQAQSPNALKEAALLSLTILPYAHMLSAQEINSALQKCKDHSPEILERACDAIFKCSDTTGDISPDVLFRCARHYEDIHNEKQITMANSRKTSGTAGGPGVAQLHHMNSYPGASPGAPQVYLKGPYQNPYAPYVRNVCHHPTSPIYSNQPPIFKNSGPQPLFPMNPQMPSGSQLQPPGASAQGAFHGLHQSHSAPQLSESGGGTASSRILTCKLIKAYQAGVKAMGAISRSNESQNRHYSKANISPYLKDIEWMTKLVIDELKDPEIIFEFFEHVHQAVTCPYTLLHVVQRCWQINKWANANQSILPHRKYYNQMKMPQAPQVQSLMQQPPPRISDVRKACNNQPLADGSYHPILIDLLEKCMEQFTKAIQAKLSYSNFQDHDRVEAERIMESVAQLVRLIPNNTYVIDSFLYTARRQRNWKKDGTNGLIQKEQMLNQCKQVNNGPYFNHQQHMYPSYQQHMPYTTLPNPY